MQPNSLNLTWTRLGTRLGFTSEQPQRDEILGAIDRMNWTPAAEHETSLDGAAIRAVVNAVYHHHRNQLRLVGVAQLNGGRQLVGLEDTDGTRSYLIDLDDQAIYVLEAIPGSLHKSKTQRRRQRAA